MAETVKKFLDYEGLQYFVSKLLAGEVKGKGLSSNDLTDALVAKINSTATSEGLNEINTRLAEIESLIESDKDGAINKFNEIVAFLTGVADTKTLDGLLADIATQIGGKVDKETGKGLSTNDYTTAEKNKLAAIEAGAQKNTVTSVAGKTGVVVLAKTDVGLANVDNTSDLKKPVSEATQAALDLKANATDLTDYQTANDTALGKKVDKVAGKGLSTNDYTTADKQSLTTTAERVESLFGDWETTLEDSFITNQTPAQLFKDASAALIAQDNQIKTIDQRITGEVGLLDSKIEKKLNADDLVALTTAEIDALISA